MYEMSFSLNEKSALKTYLNISFVLGWIVSIISSPSPLPNSRKQFLSFVPTKILVQPKANFR